MPRGTKVSQKVYDKIRDMGERLGSQKIGNLSKAVATVCRRGETTVRVILKSRDYTDYISANRVRYDQYKEKIRGTHKVENSSERGIIEAIDGLTAVVEKLVLAWETKPKREPKRRKKRKKKKLLLKKGLLQNV